MKTLFDSEEVRIRKAKFRRFLMSLMNPKTGMALIGMFWLIIITAAPLLLLGAIIGGRLTAALTAVSDAVLGMGMVSIVAVPILTVRKFWREHRRK